MVACRGKSEIKHFILQQKFLTDLNKTELKGKNELHEVYITLKKTSLPAPLLSSLEKYHHATSSSRKSQSDTYPWCPEFGVVVTNGIGAILAY